MLDTQKIRPRVGVVCREVFKRERGGRYVRGYRPRVKSRQTLRVLRVSWLSCFLPPPPLRAKLGTPVGASTLLGPRDKTQTLQQCVVCMCVSTPLLSMARIWAVMVQESVWCGGEQVSVVLCVCVCPKNHLLLLLLVPAHAFAGMQTKKHQIQQLAPPCFR